MSRYGHQCECAARACESVKHVAMKYASAPSLDNAGVRRVVRTLTPLFPLRSGSTLACFLTSFIFFWLFPKELQLALNYYTKGLETARSVELRSALLCNRSHTRSALKMWSEAMSDASGCLESSVWQNSQNCVSNVYATT